MHHFARTSNGGDAPYLVARRGLETFSPAGALNFPLAHDASNALIAGTKTFIAQVRLNTSTTVGRARTAVMHLDAIAKQNIGLSTIRAERGATSCLADVLGIPVSDLFVSASDDRVGPLKDARSADLTFADGIVWRAVFALDEASHIVKVIALAPHDEAYNDGVNGIMLSTS